MPKVTMDQIKVGARVRVDFQHNVEEGVLIGEVQDRLWVADFPVRGIVVMSIEVFDDLGGADEFSPDTLVTNPTNPDDLEDAVIVMVAKLKEGGELQ